PGAPLEVKNISAANAQILWLTKPQTGGGGAADQGGYLLFGGGATGSTVRGYFGFTQASGGIQTILTGASNDAIALRAEGALQFGTGGDNIRMTVLSTGNVGIGTTSPQHPLHMGSGAHVTAAGVWTNASSREYKENIRDLTADEAMQTLDGLRPTRFNYKVDKDDEYVGFIAEDVPDLVATRDRKGLSPMDLTAVLTKAVQEQQRMLQDQKETIDAMKQEIEILKSGRNSGVKGL
ncbi:MAG: tail fiber domain-containing protein, partial [Deltaproteobacteria bacterium]